VLIAAPPPPSWDALEPIEGALLFACQTAPATGDLYFKDDAGAVHRLTVTEPNQGAGEATWYGNRILAVIDRDFQNGLEIRSLTTRPDAVGKRLGEGATPAVSPTGTIAYVFIRGQTKSGRLVDEIVRLRAGHRRVLWKHHAIVDLAWASRRRVIALAENRTAQASLVSITRRAVRSIRVGKRAGAMALSRQRRVAISHGSDRVTIMRLDGTHRHTFRRAWAPWAWSPNGRSILVSGRGRTIGLMNPRTGAVRRLGRLPCGYLTSAEWTPPGRHPWPGAPR
jgi:hypothetical protein